MYRSAGPEVPLRGPPAIRHFHRALDEHAENGRGHQVDIVQPLLPTGHRGGEILLLRWSEFEDDMHL